MTDYMAIPVSPVTESEMVQVKTIFERMAASVVAASGALESLQSLRNDVEAMRRDLETQRNQNMWLDEQLSTVRRERDEAIRDSENMKRTLTEEKAALQSTAQSWQAMDNEVTQLREELRRTKGELDRTVLSLHNDSIEVLKLQDEIVALKRERDDAQFKNMELTDECDALRKQRKAMQDLICPPTKIEDWSPASQDRYR